MNDTTSSGSARSYSFEQIRAAIGGDKRHTDIWLGWLTDNGLGNDDHLTEDQAVAVAAGARFSAAKVPKPKITKLVRKLLGDPPEIHIDWVAVERPGVKDIEIEPGPFKGGPNKPKQRLPIVFDPYGVLERLRES